MNAMNFQADLRRKTEALKNYAANVFPTMAANKTLRFIEGNFRAQGWQGTTFDRWAPLTGKRINGRILVRTGKLRRGWRKKEGNGEARIWNTQPYAMVHNRGFKGIVRVKEHQRRQYTARRIDTGIMTKTGKFRKKTIHEHTGTSTVKSHTRRMNIPKRQMAPERIEQSPVLVASIRKEIIKEVKNIFN